MTNAVTRWGQFVKERFEPISSLSLISLFFFSHWVLLSAGHRFVDDRIHLRLIALLVGTVVFFFKLRLYDEIKDYEVDCRINPTRPLARGLFRPLDLKRAIVICIAVELLTFSFSGIPALTGIAIAIVYSLLMYKEFFISRLIRPHLTTYAVSHTVVSSLLSIALLSAMLNLSPWSLTTDDYRFALNSWCLFNIFEFGRKSFATEEEREGVDSYSQVFGRFGAVFLVLVMAASSAWLILTMNIAAANILPLLLSGSAVLLALLGLSYAAINRTLIGRIYRSFSSLYIVLIYVAIIAGYLAAHLN